MTMTIDITPTQEGLRHSVGLFEEQIALEDGVRPRHPGAGERQIDDVAGFIACNEHRFASLRWSPLPSARRRSGHPHRGAASPARRAARHPPRWR